MTNHPKHKTVYLLFIFVAVILCNGCNKPDALHAIDAAHDKNGSVHPAAGNTPNIILILGDDTGYEALAHNGNETFQTPYLDRMANEGMRFTQCYSSPLCSPSRFMFVTGKYNFRNYTLWGEMNPVEKTIATLLRNAGYATFVAGKWQFNGGAAAIYSTGYDNYCVWNPSKDVPSGPHYKNPKVFENGVFLDDAVTNGKYGDDIFTDRVLTFIKQNSSNKFFVYFPITLCHDPFSPTPDDPEFASWKRGNDTTFFPSMIKYMDKKIGQITDSLKKWQLYNNTIILFAGDNGTPRGIFYNVNGVRKEGQKGSSKSSGTHVPLLVTWPNGIAPGQVNNSLVDFTDILPTFADAAALTIPPDYGNIDGKSFYNQLRGLPIRPGIGSFVTTSPILIKAMINLNDGFRIPDTNCMTVRAGSITLYLILMKRML